MSFFSPKEETVKQTFPHSLPSSALTSPSQLPLFTLTRRLFDLLEKGPANSWDFYPKTKYLDKTHVFAKYYFFYLVVWCCFWILSNLSVQGHTLFGIVFRGWREGID